MQSQCDEMQDNRPKPWNLQKLLLATLGALTALSLVLLSFFHLNLPSDRLNGQFLRSGYRDTTDLSLRELFKRQADTFNDDQQRVVDMTRHAWRGYRRYARWKDYLDVRAMRGGTVYRHDMALTTVDALDTLFIMGLHDEFDEASAWVKANLSSTMMQEGTVSFFEITIRSLGGLLSAFYLSGEQHFLDIATSLGRALQNDFICGNHVPCRLTELKGTLSYDEPFLAEVGSFQLEFAYLARASKDYSFLLSVNQVNSILAELVRTQYPNGLIPVSMDWGRFEANPGSVISVGALGDSYYEYLLKQWLLSGKRDDRLRDMYMTAVKGMQLKLVGHSYPSNYAFIGKLSASGVLDPAMEHLTCFVPGMLALGYLHGMPTSHLDLAKELAETCAQMYLQSATHLAPEITQFTTVASDDAVSELYVHPTNDYNALRPETVESLMVLYRVTGDDVYREHGRTIMAAFEQHSKVSAGGYRSTSNVWYGPPSTHGNVMESFFLAETLKYLFLLFSDATLLSLDDVVFNTEAHAFPVR